MKLTIFPNWCKWLSLALFVSFFIIDFDAIKQGFRDGVDDRLKLTKMNAIYQSTDDADLPCQITEAEEKYQPRYGIGDSMIILAIIVYILSKDKRDDEFINSLRAKALLIALLAASILVGIFGHLQWDTHPVILLAAQLVVYIIIFKILKIRAEVI